MKSKEWIERQDETVKRCLAVAASPHGTFYMIETTFETWPRFVVGDLRESDGAVRHLCRTGLEQTAREFWDKLCPLDSQEAGTFELAKEGL